MCSSSTQKMEKKNENEPLDVSWEDVKPGTMVCILALIVWTIQLQIVFHPFKLIHNHAKIHSIVL